MVDPVRLPFAEQIAFFRQKLNLPTERWTDIQRAAHDRAFVVAGAMAADLLDDLRGAVDKAIAGESTLADFRRDFLATIEKHGWQDFTGDDRATQGRAGGRALAWRTRTIYHTNILASRAAGRWQQLHDPALLAERPYWRYVHSDFVSNPRPQHKAWGDAGLTLPHDHPFWKTHFPPNGWGCFPADTPVRCDALLGQRFVYTGEMVEFETRLGHRLALTPNHPVMTSKGWVAAGKIEAGHEVLTAPLKVDSPLRGIVDDPQPPARADDLFEALAAQGLRVVPMAANDFHGDALGGEGEIHIAGADGRLMDVIEATTGQIIGKGGLDPALHSRVKSARIPAGAPLGAQRIEHAVLAENAADCWLGNAETARDGGLTQQAGAIQGQHLAFGSGVAGVSSAPGGSQVADGFAARLDSDPARGHAVTAIPNGDASQPENTRKRGTADAVIFGELLEANSGLILRDEVCLVRKFNWSGHVFDFTTSTGLIMAGGIVVSNCRCTVKAVAAPKDGDATAPPEGWDTRDARGRLPGIDAGWDYAPGANTDTSLRSLVQNKLIGYPPAIANALSRDVTRYISTRTDLAMFARKALDNRQKSEDVWLGFVGDRLDGVIARDVRDFLILLRADGVRHVDKEHGFDGGSQRAPTPDDYADAGKWLPNGRIEPADPFVDRYGNEKERVKVTYDTGGGRKVSIWEVRPGRRNRALVLISMWVKR